MQNYKLQQKLIKTKPVTYYQSSHTKTQQKYIIKKLNKDTTWQALLQSKPFSIIKHSKCKYFSRIKQVIKQQQTFYCIMQHNDINLTKIIANDIQRKDIYKISKQLIQLIVQLDQEKILIRDIRPSHIFFNNNKTGLKIYHFQTFNQKEKDYTELDLTEIQDMRYISPQEILTRNGFNQKCMIFSVALIICELIMGQPLIKAKNKLQYIYQLTQLFPNQRIDKMKGSQHQFKQQTKLECFQQKIKKQDISDAFISLLTEMLTIDHNQRIQMRSLMMRFDQIIEEENQFQKNKSQGKLQANYKGKPNKNQINFDKNFQVQFDFQNKPTLSIIPQIFTHKIKNSNILPQQQNIQDDGNQPIIIKQSLNKIKTNFHRNTQKDIHNHNFNPNININLQTQHSRSNMNINTNTNKLMPIKYNQMINSRSTKQTISTSIRKPQLTNYAMNQANLGIKLGMNATLFSDNQNDF